MNIDALRDALKTGTVDQLQNTRQNRFTHLLLLREVTAPARFTTDGETMTTMDFATGDPNMETTPIRAVDLFYRKQPGAERRTGKAIQRDLVSHIESCSDDHMHPNKMNQNSVESILFGSAAGDKNVSQRSRVYYDSTYSLRDIDVSGQQNRQTASGGTTRSDATKGQGTWTHDFVKPGTLFPCSVTLDSATPEEVLLTMAIIDQTTRYGAATSRGGCMRNHFLGVYCGTHDAPANYELNRVTAGNIAAGRSDTDTYSESDLEEVVTGSPIPLPEAKKATKTAFTDLAERRRLGFSEIDEDNVHEALLELKDNGKLASVFEDQHEKVTAYLDDFQN